MSLALYRRAAALAAAALSLASVFAFAPAASAETPVGGLSVLTAPGAATVGQSVVITGSLAAAPDATAGGGVFAFTAGGQAIGSVQGAAQQSSASFTYTPSTAGDVSLGVTYTATSGSSFAGSYILPVALAPSITSVSAPTSAKAGTNLQLAATVSSVGSLTPTGSVTFTVDGSRLAPVAMSSGKAALTWPIPAGPDRTIQIVADYSGDAGHAASKGTDSVAIRAASGVSVTVPTQVAAGTAVTVIGEVSPATATGTLTLTVNGTQVGSPVALVNGLAAFQWTPASAGIATVRVSYSGSATTPASYEDDAVVVTGPAATDTISATFNGAPWSSPTLGNKQSAAAVFNTASGAPASVLASGPCLYAGTVLTSTAGSGVCTLTVSSPGSASLAAKQQTFTVSMVPGAPTASWKQAGSVRKGSFTTLAPAGLRASSGQLVSFKVVSGSSKCSLSYSSSIRLKGKAKGSCKVRASAPAVPGQFAAYSQTRTFTVK